MRPPFNIFPELSSDRILLRELVASDLPANIDITYFQRVPATNMEEALHKQAQVREGYLAGDGVHWGIEDLTRKEIVGCCGFYRGFANDAGEIGYLVKEKFRGKGYMSEAVGLMLQFGFNTMKLQKIFAITGAENFSSQSVLRKNNLVHVSTEPNGDFNFQILREDYR